MRKRLYLIVFVLVVVASLVFSGRRTNPPIENEVEWASSEAMDTFYRSCADCHSHETKWPWYSYLAPISWRVIEHVDKGRAHFNISTPDMGDADEAAETVQYGTMPLPDYLWLHPDARLSKQDRSRFIADLIATFGGEPDDDGHDEHDHDKHHH
jgi:hypothetical protein